MGGAERALYELSRRLTERGYEVTILTGIIPNAPREEIIDDILVIRSGLPVSARYLRHLTSSLSILRRILGKTESFDLIHSHMIHYPTYLALLARCRGLSSRVIATAHGSDVNRYLMKSSLGPVLLYGLRHTNAVIGVSRPIAEALRRFGVPPNKIQYIPNGVDTAFFIPTSGSGQYDLLFFGRLKKEKGIQFVLTAVAGLKREGRRLKLAIVGQGPFLVDLKLMVPSLGIESSVDFLGAMQGNSLRNVIWSSKIVVVPSLTEGLPLTLLEAMSCGKPVISARVGGIPDVVTDGVDGLLVQPGDAEALKDKIRMCLDDSELRDRLGKRARLSVEENFDWDRIVEKTMCLYDTVLMN